MLWKLCVQLPEPAHPGRGPKPKNTQADLAYTCIRRVHRGWSAREIKGARAHYNSVLAFAASMDCLRALLAVQSMATRALNRSRRVAVSDFSAPLTAKSPLGRANELVMRDICSLINALVRRR